jgi:high affinity Mn2+ porin
MRMGYPSVRAGLQALAGVSRAHLERSFLGAAVILLLLSGALYADESDNATRPSWFPQLLGAQATFIYQNMPAFHSPYIGADSLRFDHGLGRELSQTYGVYLGSQVTKSLQLYGDVEMFQGQGLSKAVGLGGYSNGDAIRAGSANIGKEPYLARLFARYLIPLSGEMGEPVERGEDQLPGKEPADRIEIKGGKLTPTDDFDQNRYANNERTQFLNFAFLYNTAWDYVADTRGYTIGASGAIVHPSWRLALGSYQINTERNGPNLDPDIARARGDQAELTLNPGSTVVRLLVYRNEGNMGDYREALAQGFASSTAPDVLTVERAGHVKYGAGLNVEQPLADKGETGLFARIGWENGSNATWTYTDVDRTASLGLQVAGSHWGRTDDRFGIACAAQGLTGSHRHYLAAGGIGLDVGDGALNYGLEQILEAYYRIQIGKYVQLSPDYQHVVNPAYNKDRGPADIYGLRLRVSY